MIDDPGRFASNAAPSPRFGAPLVWAALLALGQAATLAMVHAGPQVRYQHYVVPWKLTAEAPWALAIFVVECFAVVWGISRSGAARRALRHLRGWRFVVVVVAFVLTSATGSLYLPAYATELVFAPIVQLVHLGAVLLFATSLSQSLRDRIAGFMSRILGQHDPLEQVEPSGPDRLAWTLAVGVAVLAAVLAIVSYERHPHVPDEVVYLLQARYLAEGMLSLPLPPALHAFNIDLMTYQVDRWFSPVPPGWPFLLAAATAVGATWLLNPLLGGINILLASTVLRELYPLRTARIAIILLAASPWHLFMSMNIMTHTATLTAALGAAAAVARLRRDPRLRWAVLGGLGIGIVGLIRPLEAVPVALLLGFWSLGARGVRIRLLPSITLTFAAIVTSSLVLPYNKQLTGSFASFPIMAYTDATYGAGTNALGFGGDRGLPFSGLDPFPGHGAVDVLVNANFNLFQTNIELLGWATGSLLVIALFLVSGRLRRPDAYLLAVIASVAGIHAFYYFSGGPDFGARYWYLIIVPCIALAARGIVELESRVNTSVDGEGVRVIAAASLLTAIAVLIFVPWRAADKYHHYRGMQPHVREFATAPATRGGIVLIRGRRHPDFASAFTYNSLDLTDGSTVFAWDRGPDARRELVEAYPGRTFWIVEGPTVTGAGFALAAGPLRGDQLIARQDSVIPWP